MKKTLYNLLTIKKAQIWAVSRWNKAKAEVKAGEFRRGWGWPTFLQKYATHHIMFSQTQKGFLTAFTQSERCVMLSKVRHQFAALLRRSYWSSGVKSDQEGKIWAVFDQCPVTVTCHQEIIMNLSLWFKLKQMSPLSVRENMDIWTFPWQLRNLLMIIWNDQKLRKQLLNGLKWDCFLNTYGTYGPYG